MVLLLPQPVLAAGLAGLAAVEEPCSAGDRNSAPPEYSCSTSRPQGTDLPLNKQDLNGLIIEYMLRS